MSRKVMEMLEELNGMKEDRLHIELSNTYLAIERGDLEISITSAARLSAIVLKLYGMDNFISDYWMNELYKLPGWINV